MTNSVESSVGSVLESGGALVSGDANVREAIRTFLCRYSSDESWLQSDDLLGSGVITSLAAMEIVSFIESAFGISIDDDDLDMRNFNSVDGMTSFVSRKLDVSRKLGTEGG